MCIRDRFKLRLGLLYMLRLDLIPPSYSAKRWHLPNDDRAGTRARLSRLRLVGVAILA